MNSKTLTGLLSGIVLGAVGLSAQSGAASSSQTPSTARPEETVTVVGCVQKAEPGASAVDAPSRPESGTTSTVGGGADDKPKFVLTNVMPKGAATDTQRPTGTAGSSSASSRKFPLDAAEGKLTPHVGHQVEITGTFATAIATATVGVSGVPTLKVESLRMIAASCSQ
jgi:hypothetical protein